MHMYFLAFSHQYLHSFSFQRHRLFFSHDFEEVSAGKEDRLNRGSNSQPPVHESDTLTTQPPGGRKDVLVELGYFEKHFSSVTFIHFWRTITMGNR